MCGHIVVGVTIAEIIINLGFLSYQYQRFKKLLLILNYYIHPVYMYTKCYHHEFIRLEAITLYFALVSGASAATVIL